MRDNISQFNEEIAVSSVASKRLGSQIEAHGVQVSNILADGKELAGLVPSYRDILVFVKRGAALLSVMLVGQLFGWKTAVSFFGLRKCYHQARLDIY